MDYSYTAYGANGAIDGGGFVAGEPQSSPSTGKGNYGKDTVRPMTIKQILDAQQPHPDAEFRADGENFSQVTFVGQIRSVAPQPTNITYKIDDGTGIIEAKQWVDSEAMGNRMDEDSNKPKLVEDAYCRVWGRLKSYNNKRHVGAHVIRPITDLNEINYHLLEATAVHLYFTKGPPPSAQANGHKTAGGAGVIGGPQDVAGGADPSLGHFSPLARRVLATMKKTTASNEGLHVQMIASQAGMPVSDVYKGAEELAASGAIFTTVDDNTWALMEV